MPSIAELLAAKPKTIDGLPDFLKAAAYSALQPDAGAVPPELANLAPVTKGEDAAQSQEPNTSAPAMSGVSVDAPNIHLGGTSKVQLTQDEANSLKGSPIPAPIAQAAAVKSSPLSEVPPVALAQATQPTALDKGLRIAGGVAAGLQVAGRGGDSGAKLLIANRQHQDTLALEKQKAAAEVPLKEAQADWYSGRNQTSLDRERLKQEGAANVANIRTQAQRLGNYITAAKAGVIVNSDGSVRQMTKEEIAQAPMVEAAYHKMTAEADVKEAQAAAANAHADVMTNPNNVTYQQNERKIQATLAMAQKRLSIAEANLSNANETQKRNDAQFQINNGVKADGSPAAIQAAGQAVGPNGETVGAKFVSNVAPTAASKNMGQMAATVIPHLQELSKSTVENGADLGPFIGRISNVMVNGFKSTGDPAKDYRLNRYFNDMKLATSAVARTHFGGKTGPAAMAYFKDMLDAAKTPEGIKGVIDSAIPYMSGYQDMGTVKTNLNMPQRSGGTSWSAPKDAPAAPKEDGHQLKKDGKVIATSKGGQWVQP